jgi:hypothetical protein
VPVLGGWKNSGGEIIFFTKELESNFISPPECTTQTCIYTKKAMQNRYFWYIISFQSSYFPVKTGITITHHAHLFCVFKLAHGTNEKREGDLYQKRTITALLPDLISPTIRFELIVEEIPG